MRQPINENHMTECGKHTRKHAMGVVDTPIVVSHGEQL